MATAIYTRLSRDRYGGMSTSTADQQSACIEFCEQRGWSNVEVFTDHDVSASGRRKRPAWTRLLERLDEFDAIVCWSSDRLYRQPRDLELLIDFAEHGRLTIHALRSSELDLTTPEGRAVARTLAAWNRAEVERMGERISRKNRSRALEGKPQGTRRPFAYERDGVTIRDDEAQLLRAGAEAILAGASLMSVVRLWNLRSTGTSGGAWTPNSARRILTSPRYAGLRVHRGEVVGRAVWKPIITRRVHDALVRVFADVSRGTGRGERYLLTGLLFCARCDGRMNGRPNNGVPAYVCKASGKLHMGAVAFALEQAVTRIVSDWHRPEPVAVADPRELSEMLLRRRDTLEQRLADVGTSFARDEISVNAFRAADAEFSAQLVQVDTELDASAPRQPARTYLRALHIEDVPWSEVRTDLATRIWLEGLVERVVLHPARRGATTFEDERVEVIAREGVIPL